MSDPLLVQAQTDGSVKVEVSSPNSPASQDVPTPLSGFLSLTNPTPEEADQMKEVWDYVKSEAKSDLESERLWTVQQLEAKLSTPRLGQTRISQLYQYVKLSKQIKSDEKLRAGL